MEDIENELPLYLDKVRLKRKASNLVQDFSNMRNNDDKLSKVNFKSKMSIIENKKVVKMILP